LGQVARRVRRSHARIRRHRETIVDQIEAASAKAAFVIVDLEGTANLLVSYAISFADFVVILAGQAQGHCQSL
jgi:ribosomal silencing factor RsfS